MRSRSGGYFAGGDDGVAEVGEGISGFGEGPAEGAKGFSLTAWALPRSVMAWLDAAGALSRLAMGLRGLLAGLFL
jgi:hypothetical protein